MIYKVLCVTNNEVTTDRFETRSLNNHEQIAADIRRMYEGSGIEVVGVIRVSEIDVDVL